METVKESTSPDQFVEAENSLLAHESETEEEGRITRSVVND